MSFSGGTFTPAINWVNEAASAPIEIAKHDTQDVDFASGLSNALLRDGTGVPTSDTPWNNQKITGLGAPVSSTDAARIGDGLYTEQSVASGSTCDIGAASSHLITISGTTTITSFGSSASLVSPVYIVKFEGILTLTYNAASLITPIGQSYTTSANDWIIVKYLGAGNWRVLEYNYGVMKGSYTATLTGCTTSPTTTVVWNRLRGHLVHLGIVAVEATSNTNACTLTGAPAIIRPNGSTSNDVILVRDNTTLIMGYGSMGTNGTLTLNPVLSGNWTASGTKGVINTSLIYPLYI